MTPVCEAQLGKQITVNTLYFDHGHSDNHNINIVLGTDKGAKFYTLRLQEKHIEEKRASLEHSDSMSNIFGVAFHGDDIYVGGENGYVYVYR